MARAAETSSAIRPPTSAQIDTLLPGEGIYAGRAWIDGRPYATAMSLGGNPTFDESEKKVEAFLLDYHGDLYGRPIEIDFLARLRDIKRFDSADQLVDQMALDVQETRRIATMESNAFRRKTLIELQLDRI